MSALEVLSFRNPLIQLSIAMWILAFVSLGLGLWFGVVVARRLAPDPRVASGWRFFSRFFFGMTALTFGVGAVGTLLPFVRYLFTGQLAFVVLHAWLFAGLCLPAAFAALMLAIGTAAVASKLEGTPSSPPAR